MGKRLQVILQDPEYKEIQRMARAQHMTLAEWVRQTLSHARRQHPVGDVDKKIQAIRAAAEHESPTSDIDTMLAEIERGYSAGQP